MNSIKYSTVNRSFSLTLTVIVVTCIFGFSACETPETEMTGVYAFTGVNVVPMNEEKILENYTVIVSDGRISAVSPADEARIPDIAQRIDGSGKYLMPGLAEMHGHIPGPENPQYAEDVLFLYISNGVTTVRNMAGNPYHLELRERLENGEIPGPTIFAATPWLSPDTISDSDEAEVLVQRFRDQGFDHMKMGGVSLDVYRAIAEAAHEIGLPFAGHIPEEVGLVNALEARQKSIDHYDRYTEFLVPEEAGWDGRNPGFFGSAVVHLADESRIADAVEKTIEAGTWNVPTLSLIEHLASPESPEEMAQWPEMKYMPAGVVDGWIESKHNFQAREDFQPDAANSLVEIRQKLTKELHDRGALIALGSDAPQFFNVPGFSIHHEMEMMVATGLSPYQVLVTGTRNAAKYFDTPDEFGTVQENRLADLILLNANPLEDIANVKKRAGVMVWGEWWPEEKIQEKLSEIARE
jgi:imidazolonepropionase-like amidohydrolase